MEKADIRVRGLLISQQRDLLRKTAGDRYSSALLRVPEQAREEYESVGVLSWCRQSSARAVTEAVAVELDRSPIEMTRYVVETSTRAALRGPWAVLLRMMTDDDAIVRRASVIFEKAFDRGTLRATQLDSRLWRVKLEGWPQAHAMDIESIACGMSTLLDVLNRPATVSISRRGAIIDYTIALTPP